MQIDISVIRKSPYFSNLGDGELDLFKRSIFNKSFERKASIIREGEPAKAIYFVSSGAVKTYRTSPDGKEQIFSIVRPGDSFNDIPVLDGAPTAFSAEAMGPVSVIGISKDDFYHILRDNHRVAINVINVLAGKIRQLTSIVDDFSFRTVTHRVAKLLLNYAGDGTDSFRRLTQEEMAGIAGTSREVVARALKSLSSMGAITIERHRIVIKNTRALEDMAGVIHSD